MNENIRNKKWKRRRRNLTKKMNKLKRRIRMRRDESFAISRKNLEFMKIFYPLT